MSPTQYLGSLSRAELAKLAGSIPITLSHLKAIIKEKKSCRLATVQAICNYSNGLVTVQEWFDWLEENDNG